MSSTEGWKWVHAWAACGWDSKWYALIGLAGLGLMGCVDTGALGSVSSPLGDREALVCEGDGTQLDICVNRTYSRPNDDAREVLCETAKITVHFSVQGECLQQCPQGEGGAASGRPIVVDDLDGRDAGPQSGDGTSALPSLMGPHVGMSATGEPAVLPEGGCDGVVYGEFTYTAVSPSSDPRVLSGFDSIGSEYVLRTDDGESHRLRSVRSGVLSVSFPVWLSCDQSAEGTVTVEHFSGAADSQQQRLSWTFDPGVCGVGATADYQLVQLERPGAVHNDLIDLSLPDATGYDRCPR